MKKNSILLNLSLLILFFSTILSADQKVTLQLSWLHQFQFAGFYMAKEKGFYKDAGLYVEIKEFYYGLSIADAIRDKKVDFAIGKSSLIINKANGEDIVALGANFQNSPLMLLVTKDSGIENINDLKNKRVMITNDAVGSAAITAMLNSNGLSLSDIQIQKHSFNINDLIDNKTDAMASYVSNEPIGLENKNIDYRMFHPKDYGFDFYGDILFTSSQYMKKNPKLVKDFFNASMKGWKYAFNNINETVEVIYDKYNTQNKIKSDLLKEANELKKLVYDHTDKLIGCLDKNKLQKIVDVYKVLGLINDDVDLDNFVYEHNPHKTYAFELSKAKIIYLITVSLFIIILSIVLFVFSFIKSKLLITNSQLLQEVKNAKQELQESYEVLYKLTENVPGAIYQYRLYPDGRSKFTYASKGMENVYELSPEDVVQDANLIFKNTHKDDVHMFEASVVESVETMKEWNIKYRVNLPKKGLRWLHGNSKPEKLEDGSILWNGVINDITEKKDLEQELEKSYKTLYKLLENIPGVIYQYRLYPDGRMIFSYVSNGTQDVWELTPDDLLNDATSAFNRIHPDDLEIVASTIEYSAKSMKDWILEYRVNLPKKGLRWLSGQAKPEKIDDGSVLWHGYIQDITERKHIESKLVEQKNVLYHQAHHDSLTGLPNRVLFNDRLAQAIETAKRNKTNIALLFIDLDHFKEINDSLGHDIGDEILKVVSKRLVEIIRNEDTVARLGGDEFIVIVEELSQVQDASLIASKILDTLSNAIIVNNNTLYVSCSIGISLYPDDGVFRQNLLKFADSAMYKAKNEGRNNYQYYNSTMTELAYERVVMETSLRAALENEEFIVYYQPQVNGVTDKLIGMEALVRWQHPSMGLVSPDKFIPLAESTGLIVELDRLVMRIAMRQFAQWYKDGLNPGRLAMNLAVKQLKQEDFIETLANLMKETEFKSDWLELEVTEGQIMTNPEEAIETLHKISNLGIELAVDDFGTGYSSLAYLKKLPINKLKIDQAFVIDLPDNENDVGITRAVIALAHSLNLKIVAEGVETKEQRDFIVENGCDIIQGYFYSRPVPADKIEEMLENCIK